MPLVPLLFTMAEGQERLDGSHGSVSLAEELASSLRLCRSVGGRLKQYFVHGRFEDCSRLEDCLRMSSRNDDGDDVTVEKARCLELWTKFEGISAFKAGSVWIERTAGLEDWNSELPPDLKQRAKKAFPTA